MKQIMKGLLFLVNKFLHFLNKVPLQNPCFLAYYGSRKHGFLCLWKKKFFSKDKDILEMIFKMSFRDVFGFQKNYRIYFSNLKILITSLTDYYYFITFLDKDEERVKNLVKKSKLFLR